MEALVRELVRVAELRCDYKSIGSGGAFGVETLSQSIEAGCLAAGSADIGAIAKAVIRLKAHE